MSAKLNLPEQEEKTALFILVDEPVSLPLADEDTAKIEQPLPVAPKPPSFKMSPAPSSIVPQQDLPTKTPSVVNGVRKQKIDKKTVVICIVCTIVVSTIFADRAGIIDFSKLRALPIFASIISETPETPVVPTAEVAADFEKLFSKVQLSK